MCKILIVEDEASLAQGLEFNLAEEGYTVAIAKDGKEALELYNENDYDLIILDIMLPYIDGFEIAKSIREKSPLLPILMLTARSGVNDRVRGLELGADDYLSKPFHLEELLARIRNMLKRKQWYREISDEQPVFHFGENEINFADLSAKTPSSDFQLTNREALVMRYLIDHRDAIVSRKELLENVWHVSSEVETRTVDNFIARLRKYFEPDPSQPRFIISVRSAGYMFTVPD
ncbi:response regulator [candidate division KSB1 bacterium]|nr:response regulator [candidate division KSB1 bacterium]